MSTNTRVAPQRQAPPAPAPQPPIVVPTQRPSRRGIVARTFENTPGRLRAAALLGVVVCLLFAVLGANAFRTRGEALDAARAGAAQLVRVQQLAIDLVDADSRVTNAFLTGGQGASASVPGYTEKITEASTLLAQAAQAEPGDATALGAVNQALAKYTAAVATAQTNNGLANPVGQAYLRQASALLRSPTPTQPAMLPTLTSIVNADAARVDDAFADSNRATLVLALAGLVVFAGLLGVQFWLARRTRRIFNIPLTSGSAVVILALVLGGLVMLLTQSSVNTVRDTHYAATRALSQARIAAFDAKSNESLSLVDQSAGTAYESQYQSQIVKVRQNLDAAKNAGVADPGRRQLDAWTAVHASIRSADASGEWIKAVAKATVDSNTSFQAFDRQSGKALTAEANQVSDDLHSPHLVLVLVGWLTLLLGLVAAVSAWLGIAQRLEEYR